jgi:hypothetical protein
MGLTGKLAQKVKGIFASDNSFFQLLIKEIIREMEAKCKNNQAEKYVPDYYQVQLPETKFSLLDDRLKLKLKKNIKSRMKQKNFKLSRQLTFDFAPVKAANNLRVKGKFRTSPIANETKAGNTKAFCPLEEKDLETKSSAATIEIGAQLTDQGYLRLIDAEKEQCFQLDSIETNIGRQESNEITLLDRSVSRVHAQIIDKKYYYLVRDLNSTNGLLVNGEFVKERQLTNGDEIKLGEVRLEFGYQRE